MNISHLTKRFGDLVAVDNLDLRIFQGEVFGFLGPNGAGKTTTINMICGLSKPSGGKIIFQNYLNQNNTNIRAQIGICPQENIFWTKLTCREQLHFMGRMYELSAGLSKKRTTELLEMMGLKEKSNVLANKLSGGMKRRLNICMALIHDPEILVLDEPEAGLDPQSRVLVRDFIKSLKRDKTIILTTHNMDEADRLSDRVAIIDHGRLLSLNTPSWLKKSIGKGDLVEIILETEKFQRADEMVNSLKKLCKQVKFSEKVLIIKSKGLIGLIPGITEIINNHGNKVKEIRLRENTLEDVFIYFTGRKLR
ncbi:MAG: ATP-binding cassette domain-containing protein [Bacteroidetes bacterium]|nr:ATP-binding cassette domain-containing protein [Bacteroidota bacterium]